MSWEEAECAGTYVFAHVFVSMGLGEAWGSGHRVCKGHRQDTAELSNEDEATKEWSQRDQ